MNKPFQFTFITFAACLLALTGCVKSEDSGAREQTESVDQAATAQDEEPTQSGEVGDERVEQWSIAPGTYDCVGVAPQQCLRVRRGEGADWTLLYSGIVGFEQEPGTAYQVSVRIVDVPNPPADGSSERYELVEIVSSSPAAAPQDDATADRDGVDVSEEGADDEASGQTCSSNADCADGEMCTGPEGCDTPWTCQPRRPCTRDLRMYCSCRGETVSGSGSCPPEPFAHRGPCENGE